MADREAPERGTTTARRKHATAVGAAAMGAVTASIGIVTPAAYAEPTYPSWDDVQQAKANEAAKQAEVTKITQLIQGLQASVDAANVKAEKAAEKYFQAKDALDAATARADDLKKQADEAEAKAKTSRMRAGLLASHLARAGGPDLSVDLFLKGGDDAGEADKLLYQLGTMSKLTQQSQNIYQQAVADRNTAKSLNDQAEVAEKERAKLADEASDALAAAKAAQAAAKAALATQQEKSKTLVAQLASLKNTTATVEHQYLAGVAARKAEEERERQAALARQRAQARDQGSSESSGGGGGAPPVANGNVVQTAINYAAAQIGKPYIFGGEGPYGYDCSGLTMMAYRYAGVYIGTHSVNNQYFHARDRGQLVPYGDRQPGDLIFWGDGPGDFYHVGLYIGGGMMIAAPTEGENVKRQYVWGSPWWQVARPSA